MPVDLIRRNSPLIVTLPYAGLDIPRILMERLEDQSAFFSAPDRFLTRLLGGRVDGVNTLKANFHRFVSDVDYLPPAGLQGRRSGMIGAVPIMDDRHRKIWCQPPSASEAASWRSIYYAPYHAALAAQIAKIRAQFGHVVVLNLRARHTSPDADAPAWNFGISTGPPATCDADLIHKVNTLIRTQGDLRFDIGNDVKQGRTTRTHGRPKACSHTIEAEVHEASYLSFSGDTPFYDAHKAAPLLSLLDDLFVLLDGWRPISPVVASGIKHRPL